MTEKDFPPSMLFFAAMLGIGTGLWGVSTDNTLLVILGLPFGIILGLVFVFMLAQGLKKDKRKKGGNPS